MIDFPSLFPLTFIPGKLGIMRLHPRLRSRAIDLAITLLRGIVLLVLMCSLTLTQIPLIPIPSALAQAQPEIFSQATEGGSIRPISPEELAELKDPLFELVLKDHANETTTFEDIVQHLDPDRQQVFVVDERIVDDAPQVEGRDAHRRAIVTFDGETEGEQLSQNVFLSLLFDSNEFPSSSSIEAMAWNEADGTFNYYKLNRVKNEVDNETSPTWKFRGSSRNADALSNSERGGTCMACHINGGPVMKELVLPWNNWHSFSDEIGYLETPFPGESPRADTWPVAQAMNSPLRNLAGAETLETAVILPAIERFNDRRLDDWVGEASQIKRQVTDTKRLLKPLFLTTELNLASSRSFSNQHPFAPPSSSNQSVNIPRSFFLNAGLMRSRFNLASVLNFSFATVEGNDYQDLVRRSSTRLGNETPADSNFAWFAPEASFIDNNFVEKLMTRGVIPQNFVAAVLAVDLENPVLSPQRASLWEADDILPNQFQTSSNDLVKQTIRNLERLNPDSKSAAGQFLEALSSPDPVAFLRSKVEAYGDRERAQFASEPTRSAETARLYAKLLDVRQAVLADPNLSRLDETVGNLLLAQGEPDKLKDLIDPPVLPEPTRPTLAQGSQGDAVKELQQILQTLSFLNSPADGAFGPMTEGAVRAAQQNLKLTADGIVGPATWAALDDILARPVLRTGAQGNDVALLQEQLRRAGFFSVTVDGDFGPGTRRAVASVQRRAGLVTDGVVGPATWVRLAG